MLRLGLSLIFLLALSLPFASADQTNAERLRRGLPPLPPRRPSRIEMARRDSPSGIPILEPTLHNGDFSTLKTDGVTPVDWTVTAGVASYVDDGSGSGSKALKLTGSSGGYVSSPTIWDLIPNTTYTIKYKLKYTQTAPSSSGTRCSLNVASTFVRDYSPSTPSDDEWLSKTASFKTGSSTTSSSFNVQWQCNTGLKGDLLLDDFSIAKA